jgi:nucleolar pre-ribosomal-associated protein 2
VHDFAFKVVHGNGGLVPIDSTKLGYHGRQEYVLRWLLKKWTAKGDEGTQARSCTDTWSLLTKCLAIVPGRNAARLLLEKKFGGVLRNVIEEALEDAKVANEGHSAILVETTSKKRKRDGSPINTESRSGTSRSKLQHAVHDATQQVVWLSDPTGADSKAFAAEYMRSVIRVTAEEAAKILGGWLQWSCISESPGKTSAEKEAWLSPFIAFWTLRVIGSEDAILFSRNCVEPLLHLRPRNMLQANQLLARNVIIPAKTAFEASGDSALLKALVGDAIAKQANFAAEIFEVAVNSVNPHGSLIRRPSAWLQAVFIICKNAEGMRSNPDALSDLLEKAHRNNVFIELPVLREIISESAFATEDTKWELVEPILRLDANVFLIPETEESSVDLLHDLYERITSAAIKKCDFDLCGIVLPLMSDFAKARKLTDFIHHWYEQVCSMTSAFTEVSD